MSGSKESEVRTRRLTTILAADVVNYSGLMAADEEETFSTLKAYRGTFDKMFERHGGRVFNTAGDSILAEFSSAVEAVRCAIAIQDELQVQNDERSPAAQMQFRIGVNIGDVMVDGDNLYGDGVNVAARLEALAPPGGICASSSVHDFVKGKISFEFEDIGPQSVKNIPEPVRAFRLEPRDETGARPTHAKGKKKKAITPHKILAVGAAMALLLAVGLGVMWGVGINPLGLFGAPAELSSAQEQRMKPYVGMTVYGKASFHHKRHFTIQLKAKGVARMARRTSVVDRIKWEHGSWQITTAGNLCVEFPLFGRGQPVCRRLQHRGSDIFGVHARNPKLNPWVLKK